MTIRTWAAISATCFGVAVVARVGLAVAPRVRGLQVRLNDLQAKLDDLHAALPPNVRLCMDDRAVVPSRGIDLLVDSIMREDARNRPGREAWA